MAQFIYFVVYRKVFFYIRVGLRNVRFGLIIIVVRNKIFNPVFREKFAQFVAKLRGERFVVRYNQSGALNVLNNVSHGKSFTAARNA